MKKVYIMLSGRWSPILFFTLLLLPLSIGAALAAPSQMTQQRGREGRRTPIVHAVELAAPAVVNISAFQIRKRPNPFSQFNLDPAEEFFKEFFGGQNQRRRTSSLGTGVIIRSDGYILTNEHVISRATRILVHLANKRTYPARLVGADPGNDLAILKIDSKEPLPHLPMGRSDDLMIGETVIAIGNPFGLGHTVTTGVVSALGRTIGLGGPRRKRHPGDFIQTDASINPGNSGGPLLNIYGELIGINTAIFGKAQGIGFSIPINRAHRIVNDLILFGKVRRGWVGLVLQNLTSRLATHLNYPQHQGVVAAKILPMSPALQAGMKRGDILLSFGNKEIHSRQEYLNELSGYTVGSEVAIKFWRSGQILSRQIVLTEVPETLANEISRDWLGVRVGPIDGESLRNFRLSTTKGVVVTIVFEGSPAENIGIRPGDVIRKINGLETDDLGTFRQAIVRAREFPQVQLLVQRNREGYNVTLAP
ncbi:MAG: trypsin-like peptidase domain-containing protein [bacterium]|nr:trypsin-like peptidase domain-containing protein [bacterium]